MNKNDVNIYPKELFILYGHLPEAVLDHIDGCKSNNTKNNLRDVTQSKNMRNARRRSTNTSGITGVHFSKLKKKWIAQSVTQEGKHVHVGIYPDREEAEAAIAIFRQSHEYTQRHGER